MQSSPERYCSAKKPNQLATDSEHSTVSIRNTCLPEADTELRMATEVGSGMSFELGDEEIVHPEIHTQAAAHVSIRTRRLHTGILKRSSPDYRSENQGTQTCDNDWLAGRYP